MVVLSIQELKDRKIGALINLQNIKLVDLVRRNFVN